jgi:hypothetical protein
MSVRVKMLSRVLLGATMLAGFSVPGLSADLSAADIFGEQFANKYSGYVEVSAGASSFPYWGDDYEPWLGFGASGSVATKMGDDWSMQFDVGHWSRVESYYSGYYDVYGSLAAAHANRSFDNYNMGVFGGVLTTNGYYESGIDVDVFGGIEGQVHFSEYVTIDGQLGVLSNVSSYYPFGPVVFGQAEARIFPTDNTKVAASVGFIAGQTGDESSEKASAVTWGAEAEFQLPNTAVSGFVRHNGYFDYGDIGTDAYTYLGGLRFNFGPGSLREQNASGATHKVMDFEPLSWLRLDGY